MRNTSIQTFPANNGISLSFPRKTILGLILVIALFAFELFNFDTTRYALQNLLGDVSFAGLRWATILATAFCAIDFAGLARLFTPEQGQEEPNAVWYLMGAWLLGATMNALMTWWAVSLTLLNHNFGNEVISREQMLHIVPIFVAVLVWLTRILFIGAFSVAGEFIFAQDGSHKLDQVQQQPAARPTPVRVPQPAAPGLRLVQERDTAVQRPMPQPKRNPSKPTRIQRRPPLPPARTQVPVGMQARSRKR
jgi:hypothetical protein